MKMKYENKTKEEIGYEELMREMELRDFDKNVNLYKAQEEVV
jgi:hypothetical protein